MATNNNGKMYADSLNHMFNDLTPDEIFPYAPPQGIEALRDLWQEKILKENPDLTKDVISRPIVTNALTHGLSLVADLFVNPDDTILLPTHNWGNYKLVFNTRHNANIQTYPIFDDEGHFTTDSLVETLQNYNKDKVVMLLNYPNNQQVIHLTLKKLKQSLVRFKTLLIKVQRSLQLLMMHTMVYFMKMYTRNLFSLH